MKSLFPPTSWSGSPGEGPSVPDHALDALALLAQALSWATFVYCLGWYLAPQLVDSGAPDVPARYAAPVFLALLAVVAATVPAHVGSVRRHRPVRTATVTAAALLCALALLLTATLPPFSDLPTRG
ncbi:MAG: hypothetical protein FWE15_24480 [Actinomycetia bacterium]|nr:hypothetical protein [Actinomycetes bacterium]